MLHLEQLETRLLLSVNFPDFLEGPFLVTHGANPAPNPDLALSDSVDPADDLTLTFAENVQVGYASESFETVTVQWDGVGPVTIDPRIVGEHADSFTYLSPPPNPDPDADPDAEVFYPDTGAAIRPIDYEKVNDEDEYVGEIVADVLSSTENEDGDLVDGEIWYKLDGEFGDVVQFKAYARPPYEKPDPPDDDDDDDDDNGDDNGNGDDPFPTFNNTIEQIDHRWQVFQDDVALLEEPLPDTQVDIFVYNQYGQALNPDGTVKAADDETATLEDIDTYQDMPEFTLWDDGDYYIQIVSDSEVYDGTVVFNIAAMQIDSILELAPGESRDIPVYFTPKTMSPEIDHDDDPETPDLPEELTAELEFRVRGEEIASFTTEAVELSGIGLPGDPTDIALDELTTDYVNPAQPGFAVGNNPFIFFSGNELTLTANVTNLGENLIYSDVVISYYLTPDPTTLWENLDDDGRPREDEEITDIWLGDKVVSGGPLEVGPIMEKVETPSGLQFTEELVVTLEIPEETEGAYYLAAIVNADKRINEDVDEDGEENELENNILASNNTFLFVNDTVRLADSYEDPGDGVLVFEDVPVDENSGPQYLYFINNTGIDVDLSEIDLSAAMGGNFSLLNEAPEKRPATYDMHHAIELLMDDTYEAAAPMYDFRSMDPFDPIPTFWFYFDAEAGTRVDLETYNSDYVFLDTLEVYNKYGQLVAQGNDNIEGEGIEYIDSFIPAYDGAYYMKATFSDLSLDEAIYQIILNDSELDVHTPATEMTLPDIGTETVVDTAEMFRRNPVREEIQTDSMVFNLVAPAGGTTEGHILEFDVSASDAMNIQIFNDEGIMMFNNVYSGETETSTFKLALLDAGTYTLVVESDLVQYRSVADDLGYVVDLAVGALEREPVTLDLTFRTTATLDALPTGSLVEIPVIFTPDSGETVSETATVTAAPFAVESIALEGTGVPGDLSITDMEFPTLRTPDLGEFEMFDPDLGEMVPVPSPVFVQAGKPLDIRTIYANVGTGRITASTDIRYYISPDMIFDNPDPDFVPDDPETFVPDIPLTLLEPVAISTTTPLPASEGGGFLFTPNAVEFELDATVQIPMHDDAFTPGDYYIIAVIDPDDTVEEAENILFGDNNVEVTGPVTVDASPLVIYDSTGDLPDELLDKSLEFGKSPVARGYPLERVSLFNRSDETVVVNTWELTAGANFAVRVYDNPANEPDPTETELEPAFGRTGGALTIQPGEVRNIWVQFLPTETDPDGDDPFTLSDSLTIDEIYTVDDEGDETPLEESYVVSMEGTITGADLQIDNLNADGSLTLPNTLVGEQAQTVITLKNVGNLALDINHIFFARNDSPFSLGDYPDMLAEAGTFELVVYFDPLVAGFAQDSLIIQSTDRFGTTETYTTSIEVSAFGLSPELIIREDVDDPRYDGVNDNQVQFGYRTFATETERNLILSNEGSGPIEIDWIRLNQGEASAFAVRQAGSDDPLENLTIAAGEFLELDIVFQPEAGAFTSRFYQDSLIVRLVDAADPAEIVQETVAINGHGIFPQITTINSESQAVSGTTPLQLDTLVMEADSTTNTATDYFRIQADKVEVLLERINAPGNGFELMEAISYSVNAKGEIVPEQVFTPDAGGNLILNAMVEPGLPIDVFVAFVGEGLPAGSYSGVAEIVAANRSEPFEVALSGEVISPELTVSQNTFDFGAVVKDREESKSFTITNDSADANLVIRGWESSSELFTLALNPTDPIVLSPRESVTVAMTFRPDGSIPLDELVTGTITLLTNDVDEAAFVMQASGRSIGIPVEPYREGFYSFRDADGDLVTVSLSQGDFRIFFENGARDRADIAALELFNTTETSQLRISSRGQTQIGSISTVTTPGNGMAAQASGPMSLGSIVAPNVSITQQITISGSLSLLMVDDLNDHSAVTIQTAPSKPMTIRADQIGENVNLELAGSLGVLQAMSYESGSVQAGEINKVKILENLGAHLAATGIDGTGSINQVVAGEDIAGNIRALHDINVVMSQKGSILENFILAGDRSLNDGAATPGSIRSILALDDISSTIIAEDDITSIAAKVGNFGGIVRAENLRAISAATMDAATVSVANNLSVVKVRNDIVDSLFLAGYDIGTDLADESDNDLNPTGDIFKLAYGGELRNSLLLEGEITDEALSRLDTLL